MQIVDQDHLTRQQHALAMCQRSLEMFDGADLALDNKLMALLGHSSLLMALASMAATMSAEGWLRIIVAVLVAGAFWHLIVMVSVALDAWKPAPYSTPGRTYAGGQALKERYIDVPTSTTLAKMISDHVGENGSIKERRESTVRKGAALRECVRRFLWQVRLLGVAVCISLVSYAASSPAAWTTVDVRPAAPTAVTMTTTPPSHP